MLFRSAVDLLKAGQQLVVFPEGRIKRDRDTGIDVHLGLARLARLAHSQGVSVPVVPVAATASAFARASLVT